MENETNTPDASAVELAALKAQLVETAVAVLAGVPDHLRALIPASLAASDQIAWFNTAKATGVFDKPSAPAVAATPAPQPAITPVAPDVASLPAYRRMSAGYRK